MEKSVSTDLIIALQNIALAVSGQYTRTTDANGWTKYDYVFYKVYCKRLTFSQSVAAASIANLTVSSTNLPSDLPSLGSHFFQYAANITSGFSADAQVSSDFLTSAAVTAWAIRNNASSTRTYSGNLDVTIIER
jgi:hypothetical protein